MLGLNNNNCDNKFVDIVFARRCEDLYESNANSNNLSKESLESLEKIFSFISSLSENLKFEKETLIDLLDSYIEKSNDSCSKENELFYKTGFSDGIKSIIENL